MKSMPIPRPCDTRSWAICGICWLDIAASLQRDRLHDSLAMLNNSTSIRHHARPLLASLILLALVVLCAWATWSAAQPDWSPFVLPGARDIQYQRLSPGLDSLEFGYDGKVTAQSFHLYAEMARRGWQLSQSVKDEDCTGPCLLGEVTLIFTRQSLFNRVDEVVTVDQSGIGPYHVRVVLRRCIRLPRFNCWPPG